MIICPDLRLGTHSGSAVLHEARRIPELAHAARRASRDWWRDVLKKEGAKYYIIRTSRALSFEWGMSQYDVPAWETIVQKRKASISYYEDAWIHTICRMGAKESYIDLILPYVAFDLMVREFGMNCRICGEVEKSYHLDRPFFCSACKRSARGNIATKLLRLLEDEIQKVKRKRGETPAREPRPIRTTAS